MKHRIYLIVGSTCSGKGEIVSEIKKSTNLKFVCSHTDRPQKDGEILGKDHVFVTREQMDVIIKNEDNIVATTNIKGHRYCAVKSMVEDADVYVIDPKGAYEIIKKFSDMDIHIICLNASLKYRKKRAKLKGKEEYYQRICEENREYNEYVADMVEGTPENVHFQYFVNEEGMEKYISNAIVSYICYTQK